MSRVRQEVQDGRARKHTHTPPSLPLTFISDFGFPPTKNSNFLSFLFASLDRVSRRVKRKYFRGDNLASTEPEQGTSQPRQGPASRQQSFRSVTTPKNHRSNYRKLPTTNHTRAFIRPSLLFLICTSSPSSPNKSESSTNGRSRKHQTSTRLSPRFARHPTLPSAPLPLLLVSSPRTCPKLQPFLKRA